MKGQTIIKNLEFDSIEEGIDFMSEHSLRYYKFIFVIKDEFNQISKISLEHNFGNVYPPINRIENAVNYIKAQYRIKSQNNENTRIYLNVPRSGRSDY